jgi:WD40 repeat protein
MRASIQVVLVVGAVVLLSVTGASGADLVLPFGHSSLVTSATLSADRRWLITGGSEGVVIVWDLDRNRPASRYFGHDQAVRTVAASRNGDVVMSATQIRVAHIWDARTNKLMTRFVTEPDWIVAAAVNADGSRVALGMSKPDGSFHVEIRDTAKGRRLAVSRSYPRRPLRLAFLPGDKLVAGTIEDTAVKVWNAGNLREVTSRAQGPFGSTAVDVRVPAQYILSGSSRGPKRLELWEGSLARLLKPEASVASLDALAHDPLAVSPGGTLLASGDWQCRITLVSTDDSRRTRFDAAEGRYGSKRAMLLDFLDDQRLLAVCEDGSIAVWRWDSSPTSSQALAATRAIPINPVVHFKRRRGVLEAGSTGSIVLPLSPTAGPITEESKTSELRVINSRNGRDGVLDGFATAVNPKTGEILVVRPPSKESGADADRDVREFTFWSPDGPSLQRTELRKEYPASHVTFTPDGRFLLYATIYGTLSRLDALTLARVEDYSTVSRVSTRCLRPHPTEPLFLHCHEYGLAVFRYGNASPAWEPRNQDASHDAVLDARFARDGRSILLAKAGGAWRWDYRGTGAMTQLLSVSDGSSDMMSQAVWSVVEAPESRALAVGAEDAKLFVLQPEGLGYGRPQRLRGLYESVRALSVSADGNNLYVNELATHVLDAKTFVRRASLFELADGSWVAVEPGGRFDTNNFDVLDEFRWRLDAADLRQSLPFEVLTYSFFTPGLMGATLRGERIEPVSVTPLLEPVPLVEITSITQVGPTVASVEVKVGTSARGAGQPGYHGAFDFKLFRDDQLVVVRQGELSSMGQTVAATGHWTDRFEVELPSVPAGSEVEFSAYAFSSAGVRSRRARGSLKTTSAVARATRPRAFVVAVGINENFNSDLRLSFAAPSARRFLDVVAQAVSKAHPGLDVVKVPLITRAAGRPTPDTGITIDPTRQNVLDVLARLGGKATSRGQFPAPLDAALTAASPDDIVILYVASHGISVPGGFQFLAMDATPDFDLTSGAPCTCGISDAELGSILRDIDARALVVVLDTCASGVAIASAGAKIGPFASATLGQLVYDKSMVVLTASAAAATVEAVGQSRLATTMIDRALIDGRLRTLALQPTLKDLLTFVEIESSRLRQPGFSEIAGEGDETPRFFRLSRSVVDRASRIPLWVRSR